MLRAIARRRPLVLGYHGVARSRLRDDPQLLQVAPDRFQRQIRLLLDAGFHFVTLSGLVDAFDGGAPPAGLAAVTFDDGLRNNHDVALPILAAHGIPATVYVTVGFIGGHSPWIAAGGEMMEESHLKELAGAGWELGAHTMSHADLSTLDYAACRAEIEQSRQALERIAGVEVRTLAYPFGRYGAAAIAAARDAGMIAAVTTGSGSWERYRLTRAMIGARDPLPVILLKLTDRYEPLLGSAPARALRRASKRVRSRVAARSRA